MFGIIFIILSVPKNLFEPEPETKSEIEETPAPKKEIYKAPQQEKISEKVQWAEIKFPESEKFSVPEPPKIISEKIEEKVPSDSRLNKVCTLLLNNKLYDYGDGEISPEVWQSWRREGDIIYFPSDWKIILKIENKNATILKNIYADINFNGVEKNIPAFDIGVNQTREFEIHIGDLPLSIGSFNVDIWLKGTADNSGFIWNGKNYGIKGSVSFYLLEYNQWRMNQAMKK